MNRPLFFTPEADDELSAVAEIYRAIRPELELKFSRAVELVLECIREFPRFGPKIIKNSRRVKLKRFPYHIYYKPRRDRIVVWAVFHAHRDLKPLKKKEARA
jgi:plasmid stabilization system protein ParE